MPDVILYQAGKVWSFNKQIKQDFHKIPIFETVKSKVIVLLSD